MAASNDTIFKNQNSKIHVLAVAFPLEMIGNENVENWDGNAVELNETNVIAAVILALSCYV